MDLGFVGKVVVVTGASKGIGMLARRRSRAKARGWRWCRAATRISTPRWRRIPAGAHAPRKYMADLVRAEDAARMDRRVERDLGPIDVLVNSAGAATPLRAGRPRRRRVARAMDAEVFQLHPSDRRGAAAHGRPRAGSIVNIIGSGGKVASPVHLPGGAANSALMLATAGLAAGVRTEGHPESTASIPGRRSPDACRKVSPWRRR
jgi:NAD(P)-dependent dehydrogenase (short-subunit alcohol dehydrogenase family)